LKADTAEGKEKGELEEKINVGIKKEDSSRTCGAKTYKSMKGD